MMPIKSDALAAPYFLLGCFSEFYAEIASIKLAQAEGRLAMFLTTAGEPAPSSPAEFAVRVNSLLNHVLEQQSKMIRQQGTAAQIATYDHARYVMAALADEILILDLMWPGADVWLDVLLETRLFKSRNAGWQFFEMVAQLLQPSQRNVLDGALAPVFLLALQLGFKGRYRGDEGATRLHHLRGQLYRLVKQNDNIPTSDTAFPEAYLHNVRGDIDARLAPLSSWYLAAAIALGGYVLLATLLWVVQLYPFEKAFGG